MKLFTKAPDGGRGSGVTAYFLVEIKSLFSVALLHFAPGSREVYHDHAFNALTLWLKGAVLEHFPWHTGKPSIEWRAGQLKYTTRNTLHKVEGLEDGAWALTVRGPWEAIWREWDGKFRWFGWGRVELA